MNIHPYTRFLKGPCTVIDCELRSHILELLPHNQLRLLLPLATAMDFNPVNYNSLVNVGELENQIRSYTPKQRSPSPLGTPLSNRSTTSLRLPLNKRRSQDGESIYLVAYVTSSHSGRFPYSLVMKITASEPRDVLQSERTCLTFIRFTTALFFTALGVILNFQLNYKDEIIPSLRHPKYSKIIAYLLMTLSLATLLLSGVNYWITINRYARHKIETHNFNNFATVICVTSIVIMLIFISISLLIERYMRES